MKFFALLLPVFFLGLASATTTIEVATFDSGFGGYFTAKEIERVARELESTHDVKFGINHYGDTLNAPYGSRHPEEIARLSANGIATAFDRGAQHVFIACNTASTQFEKIAKILGPEKNGKFISIIDASVVELRRRIDEKFKGQREVTVAILATPATVKSGAYIRALADSYKTKVPWYKLNFSSQKRWLKPDGPELQSASGELVFKLPEKKTLRVVLIGPANWVDLIENGADPEEKRKIIRRDLALLSPKGRWDIVGEFCTHFPVVEKTIKDEAGSLGLVSAQTGFLAQGPLMATVFRNLFTPGLTKKSKLSPPLTRARIFISGDNVEATKTLAKEVFPDEPMPDVSVLDFR